MVQGFVDFEYDAEEYVEGPLPPPPPLEPQSLKIVKGRTRRKSSSRRAKKSQDLSLLPVEEDELAAWDRLKAVEIPRAEEESSRRLIRRHSECLGVKMKSTRVDEGMQTDGSYTAHITALQLNEILARGRRELEQCAEEQRQQLEEGAAGRLALKEDMRRARRLLNEIERSTRASLALHRESVEELAKLAAPDARRPCCCGSSADPLQEKGAGTGVTLLAGPRLTRVGTGRMSFTTVEKGNSGRTPEGCGKAPSAWR